MQEHNPNDSGQRDATGERTSRNGDTSGGRYKPGPTTMIINLGEPRPTHAHMPGQHQQNAIGGNNMRTIITNSSGGSNGSSNSATNSSHNDLLSLLAPISTVMSTSGVILATATNTMDTHHHYQTHHNLQQQQHQQQHHQINQQMLNEMTVTSAPFSGLDAQHIVHHLNESGAIIATTTMNNNNSNNSISNSSNGGTVGTVHHLGADIQLFQIPNSGANNGTNQSTSSQPPTAVVASTLAPAIGTTIETVNLPPASVGDAQIVYVSSPDVAGTIAAQHNNNNIDNATVTNKHPRRHVVEEDGDSAGVLQSHAHHHDQPRHQHQQQQQQHHGQLDMSSLSMTSEQAESLLNEAVEQKGDSQLNLLSIGDQSSFSSPGSMEIDIDAPLNDDDEGKFYCLVLIL